MQSLSRYQIVDFPYTPISIAARKLRITPQLLTRTIKKKRVPVHRVGYVLLLSNETVHELGEYFAHKKKRR